MDNGNNSARMLLVSRESAALGSLWGLSRTNSWQLEIASTGLEALERLHSGPAPDLILLDLIPGDSDGLQTMRWLRRMRPELSVILLSEPEDEQPRAEAVRLGPQDVLLKPCQEELLEKTLKRHLAVRSSANLDVELTCDEIEQISEDLFFVAGSPAMRKLRARAELLAQVNVPVLILGESGSGKEMAARLIHKLSVHSGFRFRKVNCAALPAELLESELFGCGSALNGTIRSKPGKFELCHQGTILLNEIAEMPASVQAKLVQVLEERQSSRPGVATNIEIDVRILAATSVNVERALAEKKLREDLYYQLSGFTIHVPPLREREDEIPLLLGHFMNRMSKHYGLSPRLLSPALLDTCQNYSWPGNIRELENFVKQYLVVGEEALGMIQRQPDTTPAKQSWSKNVTRRDSMISEPTHGLKSLVRDAKGATEKNAIGGALDQTHWNRKAAARLLGISYRALLYKIQEYHMSPPEACISSGAQTSSLNGAKQN